MDQMEKIIHLNSKITEEELYCDYKNCDQYGDIDDYIFCGVNDDYKTHSEK